MFDVRRVHLVNPAPVFLAAQIASAAYPDRGAVIDHIAPGNPACCTGADRYLVNPAPVFDVCAELRYPAPTRLTLILRTLLAQPSHPIADPMLDTTRRATGAPLAISRRHRMTESTRIAVFDADQHRCTGLRIAARVFDVAP